DLARSPASVLGSGPAAAPLAPSGQEPGEKITELLLGDPDDDRDNVPGVSGKVSIEVDAVIIPGRPLDLRKLCQFLDHPSQLVRIGPGEDVDEGLDGMGIGILLLLLADVRSYSSKDFGEPLD